MKPVRKGGRQKLPDGPSKVVAIRVPPADLERLKRAARMDRRTLGSFLVVAGIERAERMMRSFEEPERE